MEFKCDASAPIGNPQPTPPSAYPTLSLPHHQPTPPSAYPTLSGNAALQCSARCRLTSCGHCVIVFWWGVSSFPPFFWRAGGRMQDCDALGPDKLTGVTAAMGRGCCKKYADDNTGAACGGMPCPDDKAAEYGS